MPSRIVLGVCVLGLLLMSGCNQNDTDPDIPPTDSGSDGDDDTADCEDVDQDGWCPPQDCEDHNGLANPAQIEDCTDGFDNDCNGLTDADDVAACGDVTPPDDDTVEE